MQAILMFSGPEKAQEEAAAAACYFLLFEEGITIQVAATTVRGSESHPFLRLKNCP